MIAAQVLGVLVAGAASAVLFNVPRATVIRVAFVGLAGWGAQTLALAAGWASTPAVLAGALMVALVAEGLARARRLPATVFVVPGILPLVPGTRTYQAMLALMNHDTAAAMREGAIALFGAGGIAVGILMAVALTRAGQSAGPSNGGTGSVPNGARRRARRRPAPGPRAPLPIRWGRPPTRR